MSHVPKSPAWTRDMKCYKHKMEDQFGGDFYERSRGYKYWVCVMLGALVFIGVVAALLREFPLGGGL